MKFDFMGNRFKFFAFSGTLMVIAVILILFKGFNYGIDFKGGNIIHVRFDNVVTEAQIQESFKGMKDLYFTPEQLILQGVSGGQGKEYIIQYPAVTIENADTSKVYSTIQKDLKASLPFKDEALETANVGPTIGSEMKRQAIIAAILSVIGILLYLAWRFEVQSATGAVLSIIHDLFIVLGFVSITGMEFDVSVLAAVLTMLGYSVNDSIVVLDRIRENRKIMRAASLFDIINDSINQTLGRTINTSVTVLMTLVSLLLFGGTSIHGFSATLTFGVFFGTYSSIFIASPVLLHMGSQKEDKRRK